MTIEVTERTIGIWYLILDGGGSDWMAGMWREDDGIHLSYRFRYYRDDKFDETSEDKKNWYSMVTGETAQKSIMAVRDLIKAMQNELDAGRSWEILKGERSIEEFMEEFSSMPWTHITRIEPDENGNFT